MDNVDKKSQQNNDKQSCRIGIVNEVSMRFIIL